MNELNQIGCEEFADVAAELALGVLTGRERAEALAHLEHCDACREHVSQLTSTGEQLLALLPASEPPPGFESRVMERIGLAVPAADPDPAVGSRARHRRPRPRAGLWPARRLLAAAAVVVAVIAAAVGGWGLRGTGPASPRSPLSVASLVSASHQTAGKIWVYRGNPSWLYMFVGVNAANGTVICQLVGKNGHVTTVGSFQLTDGYGSWGSPTPAGVGTLAGARLISSDGTVLATASFAPQLSLYYPARNRVSAGDLPNTGSASGSTYRYRPGS